MPRRDRVVNCVAQGGSLAGLGALAGLACCGPLFLSWFAQLVFAAGGVAGLYFLVTYEAPILLAVATASGLAARLARDPITERTNLALGGCAVFFGTARLVWDVDYNLVMALPFVYWPFAYRQLIMGSLVAGLVVLRVAGLVAVGFARLRARDGERLIRRVPHRLVSGQS